MFHAVSTTKQFSNTLIMGCVQGLGKGLGGARKDINIQIGFVYVGVMLVLYAFRECRV